jgi:dipeptidyl aminopeptidase/acylaminoacyl peptidase
MSRLRKGFFASVFSCATAIAVSAAPQNLESFARRPQMHGFTISADGRYVAFLSGAADDTTVMTFDRNQAGGAFKRVAASEPDKFDIGWCRWATRDRVVCGLFGNIRGKRYAQPPFKRLFAVNGDGTALKALEASRDEANPLKPKTSMRNLNMNYGAELEHSNQSSVTLQMGNSLGYSVGQGYVSQFNPDRQDEVIDFTPGETSTVLIQSDDDRDGYPSVLAVNIDNANRTVKMLQSPPIQVFVTDSRGNPRLGWGNARSGETGYFVRLEGSNDWKPLGSVKSAGMVGQLRPVAIGVDPNTAYAYGDFEGRDALWSIDLTDKQPPKLLFKHPLVDVGEPILSTDRELLGVRYDVERPYVWYANPKHRELIDRLEAQFPGRAFEIVDSSEDHTVLVLQSTNDVDAGTYYLYDMAKEKLQKLGVAYPELDQKTLGTMTNIVYKAADGTEIPGYLTVPSGAEKKNLPLIVMPHDGPAARDSWKFSFLRTFLANRGYAVLQMNYRGSTGLGTQWRTAANGDWGGLVYSDIQDGTKWAVSEGIADPKRVCILGWGFGGYEALLSAARNAGTYQCAASINGVVDLALQDELSSQFERRSKDLAVNKEKAAQNSPLANAGKIDIPVLLVHGSKDWQVQMDHATEMEDALDKHEKDVTTVIIKGGTHDLDRQSDRMTLLKEVQSFVQEHLGPGVSVQ